MRVDGYFAVLVAAVLFKNICAEWNLNNTQEDLLVSGMMTMPCILFSMLQFNSLMQTPYLSRVSIVVLGATHALTLRCPSVCLVVERGFLGSSGNILSNFRFHKKSIIFTQFFFCFCCFFLPYLDVYTRLHMWVKQGERQCYEAFSFSFK